MHRQLLFIFTVLFLFVNCSKYTDHPIIPHPDFPIHSDHPDHPIVDCEIVSVTGTWYIMVKHTSSFPDHYELKQNGLPLFQHTFITKGEGNFVEFIISGSYHPGDVIQASVSKSNASIIYYFKEDE